MLNLNETLVTHDPAEALRSEAGIFEVTAPTGDKYQFVVRPGRSIANIRHEPENKQLAPPAQWRVKKIAELRSEQQTA